MTWDKVGTWIKDNADSGVSLVGSLLTGNVTGAIAAGVSMISSATGTDDPEKAIDTLKNNPESMTKLKELYYQEQENVRKHLQDIEQMKLKDKQKEHETTQQTIRSGDNAEDVFVRRTRPAQSWCSLVFAFIYIFTAETVDIAILGILMSLPFSYAGLRQVGKGMDTLAAAKIAKGATIDSNR